MYRANVFNVMIASPSDVVRELQTVVELIAEWNSLHSEETGCVLMPIHWKTHSAPSMAERGQAVINRQVLSRSDMLIAIFWTKVGTPTGEFESGTIEEIEEHIKSGKPVMIYFSSTPVALESVDQNQYQALMGFKDSCKHRGLVDTYDGLPEFQEKVRRHLARSAQDLSQSQGGIAELQTTPSVSVTPPLSDAAKQLLLEGSDDPNGAILALRSLAGLRVRTNGIEFVGGQGPREEARWEAAVRELIESGLVTGDPQGVMRVSLEGYEVAEDLPVAVAVAVPTESLRGESTPRRAGEDGLILDVVLTAAVGTSVPVVGMRVTIDSQETTVNCEFRDPAKQSTEEFPPFNLDSRQALRLTVIAHFKTRLPESGSVTVRPIVSGGGKVGKGSFSLPAA